MSEHALNSAQQPTVSEADTDFYPDPTTRFPGSGGFQNPLQPMERTYSLMQLEWRDPEKGEMFVFVALVGQSSPFLLARIPILWLERSALSTSAPSAWSFVQELVQFCVDQPGFLVCSVDEHGQRVDTSIAPRAGNYTFVTENGQPATLSVGPIGKKKGVIPSNWPPSEDIDGNDDGYVGYYDEDSGDSSSDSGDSSDTGDSGVCLNTHNVQGNSVNRSEAQREVKKQKTLVALVARDFSCLITDYHWRSCYLTPFVPISRPDILDRLDPNHGDAPRPSHGVLLTSMYAAAFNCYKCSLYPVGDGTYIIHVFVFSTDRDGVVHGSRLDRSRFRGIDEDLPNEDLLRWHYRQCVLMNIRRWAVAEYIAMDHVSDKAR